MDNAIALQQLNCRGREPHRRTSGGPDHDIGGLENATVAGQDVLCRCFTWPRPATAWHQWRADFRQRPEPADRPNLNNVGTLRATSNWAPILR